MEKFKFKGNYLTRLTIIKMLLDWGLPQNFFEKNPDREVFYYEGIIFWKQEFEDQLAEVETVDYA